MAKNILRNKDPEYSEHTEKCPHCYGRGRVPKEAYIFVNDTHKRVYEEEEAIKEVEDMLRIARES